MKRPLIALLLFFFLFPTASLGAGPTADPRHMTFPPLVFKVPTAERVVLDNGIVVYLLDDRELPLVSMQAYVGTGGVYEPADKTGLAALTGAVLRGGGTKHTTPEVLDDELEFMASSIDSGIGADAGSVSMSCLAKNLDRTLELFAQVLRMPMFREDRVAQAKNLMIEGIRRQNDDPKDVADRELRKAIYRNHPLGRYPTVESVSSLTRDDLVAFHRRYFHPNNMILAVAGDFDRAEILAKLRKAFGGWRRVEVSLPVVPEPVPVERPAVLLVKRDIDQTVIRMGHLGIDKNNPDVYAITVMNAILGGNGFSSRLMRVVRAQKGLAYNVDSSFNPGRRFPATFEAETETKPATTALAIGLMEGIISDMTRNPVSDGELSLAKDSIINSFIFAFTTPATVAARLARLEYYSYPHGYLENFRKNIAGVTKEDVLRAARKYLHPDNMILVVVGNERKFDKPLATFGTVKEVVPETVK
ncbi:MAG TPA: pitrilysin family protein [Geobacteraceae bacterium]|nr:pitrilysin family protein [Geobacteraceae bacterium]